MVSTTQQCHQCGATLAANAAYCVHCWARVDGAHGIRAKLRSCGFLAALALAALAALWGLLLYLATGHGWRLDARLDSVVRFFASSDTMSAIAPAQTWGLVLAAAGALVVIALLSELVKKS